MLHFPGSCSSAPQAGDSPGCPHPRTCWGAQGGSEVQGTHRDQPLGVVSRVFSRIWAPRGTPCPHLSPLQTLTLTNKRTQIIPCSPGQGQSPTAFTWLPENSNPRQQLWPWAGGWALSSLQALFPTPFPGSWPLEEQEPRKGPGECVLEGRLKPFRFFQGPTMLFLNKQQLF